MTDTVAVLVHGWGFDASFWRPLRPRLGAIDVELVDLGFFGARRRAPCDLRKGGRRVIAVGHSLGFLWLLARRPFDWDAAVSINGFTRFAKGTDFPAGTAARTLARMATKLRRDAAGVVGDFRRRCGADPVTAAANPLERGRLDTVRLSNGLRWLTEWDERATFQADERPCLVLAGEHDPIVPPAMTGDCFAGSGRATLFWHADGGHLLPCSDPAWTGQKIQDFQCRLR